MGSSSGIVIDETFNAGADLSLVAFKGMQVTSDNTVKIPTAALSAGFAGVLQDKPAAAGRPGRVVMLGRTKAYLGNTLTIGQKVTCGASGFFIKTTSGYASCGQVHKTASSGSIGEILLSGLSAIAATSVTAGQI